MPVHPRAGRVETLEIKALKGLMVAAAASGAGKTLVTLLLLRLLRQHGLERAGVKIGPDYLDTALLRFGAERPVLNLDPWGMRQETRRALLSSYRASRGSSSDCFWLVEAATGLFDGASDLSSSSADLAEELALPVLLVLDARGAGATISALLHGLRTYRRGLTIGGVWLNHLGSDRHLDIVTRALRRDHPDVPILGSLPVLRQDLRLPSRYLGLYQPHEIPDLEEKLSMISDECGSRWDGAGLIRAFRPLSTRAFDEAGLRPRQGPQKQSLPGLRPLASNIAIGRDAAFSFLYEGQLALWRRQGVQLSFFSPLADETPDPEAEAVFLPGGYPELWVERLAGAETFKKALKDFSARGGLVYGECGGYAALGESLRVAGKTYPMTGLLPCRFEYTAQPKRQLGYRVVAQGGAKWYAHMFHYLAETWNQAPPLWEESWDARGRKTGPCGARVGRVQGSFMHVLDHLAESNHAGQSGHTAEKTSHA